MTDPAQQENSGPQVALADDDVRATATAMQAIADAHEALDRTIAGAVGQLDPAQQRLVEDWQRRRWPTRATSRAGGS
jgi:hypothetical protein